jgi:hypothetical protein
VTRAKLSRSRATSNTLAFLHAPTALLTAPGPLTCRAREPIKAVALVVPAIAGKILLQVAVRDIGQLTDI